MLRSTLAWVCRPAPRGIPASTNGVLRLFASTTSSAHTHEVTNQVPFLENLNTGRDPALLDFIRLNGASWAEQDVVAFGKEIGTPEHIEHTHRANKNPPVLKTHDRVGNRIDEVDFHPSYHHVIATHYRHGQHAYAWNHRDKNGAHVARAALELIGNGVEGS
eukprot:TRINITY_DN3314_c0_g1_i3.p1 TRINITY_DN3314_c0_g1~~TRINITY_DN3314_c0_g1_i3.p1  ORF type:complete len:183 (-),score=6.61 TRINITY_DN3314_c0_g1_i3:19-504(-)